MLSLQASRSRYDLAVFSDSLMLSPNVLNHGLPTTDLQLTPAAK